ncbi:hypothetical protein QFZ75_002163 [Streptomyces sp. V3I8]|uniref:DUF4192 domain-containing protein n=1 Tax=Streptomyces sp. V3I8 TaxID=3042279 RepID=UPI002780EC65|nr:DUF4192 domain-containing protein [Streptomyces sp. V3I8]MDQ1035747.1 hypothetical protein [Streptomyces sp. V3I8]
MTNHIEPAGNLGDGDTGGCDEMAARDREREGKRPATDGPGHAGPSADHAGFGAGRGGPGAGRGRRKRDYDDAVPVGRVHGAVDAPGPERQVTLRTPAELADALPYLLGYRPEDSIVLVALHDRDGRGRFGGRARLGIPGNGDDWPSAAHQLTHGLVKGSERRGALPESMVAFLCQDPGEGESGRAVMERLRPLAQLLRTACGALDVPVIEALCISDGRFWSYCCPSEHCCPSDGTAMGLPGTSVLAAAATYAGLQIRGTLRELRARLTPWQTKAAPEQESALDAMSAALIPRILDDESRAGVAAQTLELAGQVMRRFADATPVARGSGIPPADLRDDELLRHDEAAMLILGLQDRTTRDRAAQWMEGDEAGPALRLWRALARRCVGSYGEHAAAPLTLAGWVAWSCGDELEAREALAMALGADSAYLFARLLHQACNEGLDPESIRRCLRGGRTDHVTNHIDEATDPGTDPGADMDTDTNASSPSPSPSPSPVGADGTSGPAPVKSSRPPSRRRRRTRATESAADRPGSRSDGAGDTRRPRSAPAASGALATEGPNRGGDRAGGAARSRRSAGQSGTPKGDT